ncbi:GrpB family protein [Alkalicella caledoniensis]|uniref:GrpB family protein n=1 Tax=Alkalicella caledoniensis TaxID=2731377 RepID=A0A7G9W6H9_ALKCA|nr:GrpB family protein [Alkalicella caledoniensis]QNO14291.1 GrpB family protein [Alkalicella caledoniensis]
MQKNSKRTIVVEPYNPKWKEEFLKIKAMLIPYIGDMIIDIVHVGSTSVEGLAAKPIIDFNIIIDSYEVFPLLEKELKKLGYNHDGDGGIKGRERFRRSFKDEFMNYHMYVCPKGSTEHLRQLAFRDYLRKNKKVTTEYAKLKMHLAEQYPHDIDNYIKGKSNFIEGIVRKASVQMWLS